MAEINLPKKRMDASVLHSISFYRNWVISKSLNSRDCGLLSLPKLRQRGHVLFDIYHPHNPNVACLKLFSQIF